jgi:hypothetical protein
VGRFQSGTLNRERAHAVRTIVPGCITSTRLHLDTIVVDGTIKVIGLATHKKSPARRKPPS